MYIKSTDIKDFQAEVFCITGVLPGLPRGDAWEHIAARDGEFTERITRRTTVCVIGERAGAKADQAEARGIRLMEWYEFVQLLQRVPLVDTAAHLRPLGSSSRLHCGGYHATGHPMAGQHLPTPSDGSTSAGDIVTPTTDTPPTDTDDEEEPTRRGVDWAAVGSVCMAVLSGLCVVLQVLAGVSLAVVLFLIGCPTCDVPKFGR